MTRVPDDPPETAPGVPALLITAGEWNAILTEDPQADPDWKVVPPYGAWLRRIPAGGGLAGLPLLEDAAPADSALAAPDDACSVSRGEHGRRRENRQASVATDR